MEHRICLGYIKNSTRYYWIHDRRYSQLNSNESQMHVFNLLCKRWLWGVITLVKPSRSYSLILGFTESAYVGDAHVFWGTRICPIILEPTERIECSLYWRWHSSLQVDRYIWFHDTQSCIWEIKLDYYTVHRIYIFTFKWIASFTFGLLFCKGKH